MPISPLRQLINSKLADRKIDPDDAREIIGAIEKNGSYSANEIGELKRLATMPKKSFVSKDEYYPNPMDSEDGVTIRANPLKLIKETLGLAEGKFEVKSTVPGVTLSLSKVTERTDTDPDFGGGTYLARDLKLSLKGSTAAANGAISFAFGSHTLTVPVKKGMSYETIFNSIESKLLKEHGGALSVSGSYSSLKKDTVQKFSFEICRM